MIGIRTLFDALDLFHVLQKYRTEFIEIKIDDPALKTSIVAQLSGLRLAQERDLHEVRHAPFFQHLRQDSDEMVEQIPSPIIDGTVAAQFTYGVGRHLVETRHDDVVASICVEGVKVHHLTTDSFSNSVAKGVG